MKNKILFVLVLALAIALFATGCGTTKTSDKLSDKLSYSFEETIKKESDLKKVAETLSKNENIKTKLMVTELNNDDYITGFEKDVTGFKKAYVIQPMIGTIPFIMYVFETDNAEEFSKTLEENAKLNWNICTEADEMRTSTYKNYVFFVMTPASFDE